MRGIRDLRIGDVVEYKGETYMFDFGVDTKMHVNLVLKAYSVNPDDMFERHAHYINYTDRYEQFELSPKINWNNYDDTYLEIRPAFSNVPFSKVDESEFIVTNQHVQDAPKLFIYGLNDWEEFKEEYGDLASRRQQEADRALTKIINNYLNLARDAASAFKRLSEEEDIHGVSDFDDLVTQMIENNSTCEVVQKELFVADIFVSQQEIPQYVYRRIMPLVMSDTGETLMERLKVLLAGD